jgi:hypothetical protein
VENLSIEAEMFETPTAQKMIEALPLEGSVSVWGEEIYFNIKLHLELEPDSGEDVAVGALAYWPAGPAFCIFFGPTPVSVGDQPRAYSPVNVFGRVSGDSGQFKTISDGAVIKITRAES